MKELNEGDQYKMKEREIGKKSMKKSIERDKE